MKNALLVGTAALVCGTAQGAFGFRYEFSTDSGLSWGLNRTVDVSSNSREVRFRVVAYVDAGTMIAAPGGTGAAVAFGRLTAQEQLTNFGLSGAGDFINVCTFGEVNGGNGNYNSNSVSGGTTLLGVATPLSIAQNSTTPIQLSLFCPSSGSTPKLEWIVRLGVMTVGRFTPESQGRVITFSNARRTQNQWYRDVVDPFSGLPDLGRADPEGVATDFVGTLTVVPAPGAIALSIAGMAAHAIRRRR